MRIKIKKRTGLETDCCFLRFVIPMQCEINDVFLFIFHLELLELRRIMSQYLCLCSFLIYDYYFLVSEN